MHGMSAGNPSDPDIVDPLTDDPLAFLYEAGDEDEDEDSTADHPGYGSLMGLSVHRDGAGVKPTKAKAMAIVLDELEAQRAAEVMEINAGQLMTNPDRSARQVGFQALGLDTNPVEEDEDDLAETLHWEAEDEDNADWQPENPLAGTGIVEAEDDDADWQPENPLAGTEFEHAETDDADWGNPLPPAAGGTAFEDEHAWSEAPPAVEQPDYREVEWETPVAAAAEPETPVETGTDFEIPPEPPIETAAFEPPAIEPAPIDWQELPEAEAPLEPAEADKPAAIEPAPVDWQELPEAGAPPAPSAPIAWESLLAKRPPKKQVDLTPIDWGEFAEEEAPAAAPAPLPPIDDGWPDSGEEPFELPAEPAPVWQNFPAWEAEEAPGAVEAFEAAEEPAAPAEPEWPGFAAEEPAEVEETGWTAFASEEPGEPVEEVLVPEAEPDQIEVLHFPAPPPAAPAPEVPHHRLRAMVMKSHQPHKPRSSALKPAARWLWARFNAVVMPLLKRLWAWARAKAAEIAARSRRD